MERTTRSRTPLAQRVRRARAVFLLLTGILVVVAGGGVAHAAPATQPITAARFAITIDGVEVASFSELGSIVSSVEVAPPTAGAPSGAVIRSARVTLVRGMTRTADMWAWHELVARGGPTAALKNASVVAYDKDNKPVARFYLENAWPSKVELGPGLAAQGPADTPMETVTIVCEHIQRVQ